MDTKGRRTIASRFRSARSRSGERGRRRQKPRACRAHAALAPWPARSDDVVISMSAAPFQLATRRRLLTIAPDCLVASKQLSFSFDFGGLDDRPPFLGIGLLQRAARLGRLLLARENLHSEVGWPGR